MTRKLNRSPLKRLEDRPLYEQLCDRLAEQIREGTYRCGEKMPSVRRLSRQMRLSITTVIACYQRLEAQGLIDARPQSGYYVAPRAPVTGIRLPRPNEPRPRPIPVDLGDRILEKMMESADPKLIQLGEAIPNPEHLPTAKLMRLIAAEGRRLGSRMNADLPPACPPAGLPGLRAQIARRMAEAGCLAKPDEVIVTNGCTEACALALRAICKPGDVVAVEAPTYFGFLHALEMLGLRVLAVPCDAATGLDLDAMETALKSYPVRACLLIPSFNNPVGSLMPEANKRRLLGMLGERGIPLIEDDLYGELAFDGRHPPVARGLVSGADAIVCSSFTKTIAPGLRIGWIVPGLHFDRVIKLKIATNLFTQALSQIALCRFLDEESYDLQLRRLRRLYKGFTESVRRAVLEYFPEGTRVSMPSGGFVIWVEMPAGVDGAEVAARAREIGMTVTPGGLFSPSGRYANFLRLNCAYWSERTEEALKALGKVVSGLAGA